MLGILWNSRSAMLAQQNKLDSISNNLSNVGTFGYKRIDVKFQDLVYDTLRRKGTPLSENPNRVIDPYNGTGVRSTEWMRQFTQGPLQSTGIKTDMAIDGEGFFPVQLANGTVAYTRQGSFSVDINGDLVDDKGNRLLVDFDGEKVPFTKDNFTVNKEGEVFIMENQRPVKIGNIRTYGIVGDNSLLSIGDNLYVPKPGLQMYETQNRSINQTYLEMSNVDLGSEMTEMIITQRAFELGSKGIKTADEMWGIVNNLRGR